MAFGTPVIIEVRKDKIEWVSGFFNLLWLRRGLRHHLKKLLDIAVNFAFNVI